MTKETNDIRDHLKLITKLKRANELIKEADKVVGTKTEVKDETGKAHTGTLDG